MKYSFLVGSTTWFLIFMAGLITGCSNDQKDTEDRVYEISSGDELLEDTLDVGLKATYTDVAENESTPFDRSFENAPPLIPHTVKGFYNITKETNQCLLCHMPNKVETSGAKQLPKTHMTDFRPEMIEEDGKLKSAANRNEMVATSTGEKLNMAMYYCNLCHVPQSDITIEIENSFTPEFRKSAAKRTSDLTETMDEGIN